MLNVVSGLTRMPAIVQCADVPERVDDGRSGQ